MTDLLLLALLALVLVYFWHLGRTWSKIPPKPKPLRRPLTDWERAERWRRLFWWSMFWH